MLGKGIQKKFPLEKLKIVEDVSNEEVKEIDKILDDRKADKKRLNT